MVDPYGRMVADSVTPGTGAQTVVADVPLGTPRTPYTMVGDCVGWLSFFSWLAFTVLQPVTERQSRSAARAGTVHRG